jgi:Chlorophyll A-B binding protein
MKTTTIAALALCAVSSASAFAFTTSSSSSSRISSSATTTTTVLQADLSKELGAQAPLGYFDPLNTLGGDMELFKSYRLIELTHGRVAMLAVVGYLTTLGGVRLPGYEAVPAGFAALSEMPSSAWLYMVLTQAILTIAMRDIPGMGNEDFPGDFRNGLDFGRWDIQTAEWKRNKRAIELNNGRAAQMGILGLMVHDYLGNVNDIIYM